jgi:hypothetical protein
LVYDLVLKCWSKFIGIASNAMGIVNDTRSTPLHPAVMITGNYGGKTFEQDRGSTNAEDPAGVIDAWGTTSNQIGGDSRDFTPRSLIVPIESQDAGNLEVNYGFNGFTEVGKSVPVSQFGGGAKLDLFVLDVDVLGANAMLRKKVLISSSGTTSSLQVQFRNRNASENFTVHPFYMSDEVMI